MAALVAIVLTGVVGAVWRLAFWQTMHGQHAMGSQTLSGPGFEWGFGLPFSVVVVWAGLLGAVLAVGFLLYQRVVGLPVTRRVDGAERERH